MRLIPKWFRWRRDPGRPSEPGFFAQQARCVFRWAVTEGKGEPNDPDFVPWMMDAAKLIPAMVAHMQAMQHEIDDLKRGIVR